MIAGRCDPGTRLARAIVAHAAAAGCAARPLSIDERDWASATFTGVRLRISLAGDASPALDAWLAAVPDAEFDIPGHLVADMAIDTGMSAADDPHRSIIVSSLVLRRD